MGSIVAPLGIDIFFCMGGFVIKIEMFYCICSFLHDFNNFCFLYSNLDAYGFLSYYC